MDRYLHAPTVRASHEEDVIVDVGGPIAEAVQRQTAERSFQVAQRADRARMANMSLLTNLGQGISVAIEPGAASRSVVRTKGRSEAEKRSRSGGEKRPRSKRLRPESLLCKEILHTEVTRRVRSSTAASSAASASITAAARAAVGSPRSTKRSGEATKAANEVSPSTVVVECAPSPPPVIDLSGAARMAPARGGQLRGRHCSAPTRPRSDRLPAEGAETSDILRRVDEILGLFVGLGQDLRGAIRDWGKGGPRPF